MSSFFVKRGKINFIKVNRMHVRDEAFKVGNLAYYYYFERGNLAY